MLLDLLPRDMSVKSFRTAVISAPIVGESSFVPKYLKSNPHYGVYFAKILDNFAHTIPEKFLQKF